LLIDPPYGERSFACRAADVDLAPQAAIATAMLACVPLTFALSFDASAIDQEAQW